MVCIGRDTRKRREGLPGKRNCREVHSLQIRGPVLETVGVCFWLKMPEDMMCEKD